MTRWLITGGCGFIGSNLVRSLLAEGGQEIRVIDNLTVGRRERLSELGPVHELPAAACADRAARQGIELVIGDILNLETLRQSARGRDVIVHLAGNTGVAPSVADPRADAVSNVIGTVNCLEAARSAGVGRFIFASSGAPLAAVEPPLHEKKAPKPASPYGASKLAGEGYCSAYWHSFGIETAALRFGNVYGPRSDDKSSVVAAFIKRALEGERIEIYGDGQQTRDFIFVGDLVEAIQRAARTPEIGGEVFQIATARETSVAEIAHLLFEILSEVGIHDIAVQHSTPRAGDAQRSYADTSKANRLLGWRAATPLSDGLRQVVDWFLQRQSGEALREASDQPNG
jgi:UDP-glucose 4-epimerase